MTWIKQKPHNQFCHDTFHAKILSQHLGHSGFWNPQINFHFSHFRTNLCWLQPVHVQHSEVFCLLQAFQNLDHFQQILKHLPSVWAHFCLSCTHLIVPESLLNHLNTFRGGMSKLNAKFDADSLLYSLSHFECNGHTVHMLTQWRLQSQLTSTVRSSLFTHTHSSPLSLAARLHQCHTSHSPYINNG